MSTICEPNYRLWYLSSAQIVWQDSQHRKEIRLVRYTILFSLDVQLREVEKLQIGWSRFLSINRNSRLYATDNIPR